MPLSDRLAIYGSDFMALTQKLSDKVAADETAGPGDNN
jgi:hypothetical protein